ncbi:DUF3822 family protein [Pedobacter metabolipauper]|uniref:Uncharacterized protein DUF3822 n=1 Tax=Pedobacter metabolipauper TaxID=425513 RepID=A0A4R6SQP9_9SPHI|nr:DUF3822 family protein [Pedobacter metabolipauper]TDQ07081.1 uncharacterized protein DUF3822 [Pedobacter metabolipauper]
MNSRNSILLVDPEFDPNTAGDCNLLLKMTIDSFSYAIIDKSNNQVKAVYDEQECEDMLATLSAKIKNDSYLALPFKEIKASVYTENTLNIPNELFDAGDLNAYAQYFTSAQSNNLYTQPFANFGFTSIFTPDQFIEEILRDSLSNYKLYDQAAPVLALAEKKDATLLILDFTVGSFNATYTKNGKLIFQNYYQTDNSEEFNYYLLFIVSQLNMNTSETDVYLSGIIHADDVYYQCIEKYFHSITFSNTTANETDSTILDDMPAHYYSSLLALDLCV